MEMLLLVAVLFIMVLATMSLIAQCAILYIRAMMAGCRIRPVGLIGMRLQRLSPGFVVDCFIRARQGNVEVSWEQFEKHCLAGGQPDRVVDAMIRANDQGIVVPFDVLAQADLAGVDLDAMDTAQLREAAEIGEREEGSE